MPSQAVLELLVTLKDQASSGLSSLGGALSSLGGVALGVAAGGIAALGAGIVSGIGDAREAAQIMAQTEAVIKSTGGAAGVTAQEVADLAGQLSAASGNSLFGDSQIQAAENYLLTFTNVKGEILTGATQIATDMAQALGTVPQAQAMQLGKALNDPVAGISALTRVGVTFTQQQKDQIAAMVEAGDTAGAQQIILAELNKEFGGSAKAAADADGGMARLTDRFGELMESIGAAVLPVLNVLIGVLNDQIMPAFEQNVGPAIEQVGSVVMPLITQAVDVLAAIWRDTLQPAIVEGARFFNEELAPILNDLGTAFLPVVSAAVQLLAGYWDNVLRPALAAAWNFFKSNIIPILADVARWLATNLPPAIQAASDRFNNDILPAIRAVHGFLANQLLPALTSGARFLGDVATAAGRVATAFGENLQRGIESVAGLVAGALTSAFEGAQGILNSAVGWFNNIRDAVAGAVRWVQDLVDAINSVEIPAWLQGHSPPPLADWFSYIADAARDVTEQMPALDAGLGGVDVRVPAGPPRGQLAADVAGTGGSTVRIIMDVGEFRQWLRAEVVAVQNDTAAAGRARGRLT